jgi:glycogen(starch) synthase
VAKELRVLVLAEAANPEWVSVPLVGWSLANALRNVADVHIVTQIRNRDALIRAGLREGVDFTAIDSEAIERPLWKLSRALRLGWTSKMALNAFSYQYFERLVWKQFGADIGNGRFDIVHRITPLSPTIVSPIAARCKAARVPFILGPLNGGVPWPKEFDAARRKEKEWLSYVRGAYKFQPGRARMIASTSAVIAGSHHTASEFPSEAGCEVVWIPENAIVPERFGKQFERSPAPPLRACFVGRLVPYKGPDMLLEAAAPLLRDGQLVIDIVGDGPMMRDLKALAQTQNLGSAVTFHGWLNHHEVPAVLGQSHVFTFPSIREFGGGVVLEAMALGTVPIVVDYGGPGELVDDMTGIKLSIGSRSEIIALMREALARAVSFPDQLEALSAEARRVALSEYTWASKAEKVLKVYKRHVS